MVPGEDLLPAQCVGPWVEDKYYFLERYLGATRFARKKFFDKGNAIYIDLFAGPGRCVVKNEHREIDNGALRVLNNQTTPFNEYHFIDISSVNVAALRKRVGSRYGCHFQCGDSNVLVHDLVTSLLKKDYKYHFAYIDPYGPDGLKSSTIEELAKLKRADLLIHFPIGAIRRNVAKWHERDFTILDEFLGTPRWREKIGLLRQGRMLYTLLDLYEEQLLRIGFPEDGLKMAGSDATTFSMLPVVSVKNRKEVELYVLILAAKSPIAQKIWNSAIKITPKGERSLF